MVWKCKNRECGKIFYVAARKMETIIEQKGMLSDPIKIEKACCPHCHCIDFKEVRVPIETVRETTEE